MNNPARVRAFVFMLLASASLFAQEYGFRTFGTTDGLTNLTVRQVYQDRVGFLWLSTENGIFRYDGERFEGFGPAQGIPNTSGAAFGDAPDGSLLVGGDFGLYRLAGNRFEKIPTRFKTVIWAQGIQSDGNGRTYLGTDSGLVELTSEPGNQGFAMRTFASVPATTGHGAFGVLVDGDTLWYGCGLQLCRKDRNGTRVFGKESGLPDLTVLAIRKSRLGDLWVRAKDLGVFEMPVGQTQFRRPATPIPGAALGVPATDANGRILLPSPEGLLIGDEKGWQRIDGSYGLHGVVYAAFEDRQHSLWIGLAGKGLVQWRGYGEWESYSAASGLANDIVYETLPRANGTIWVGTEGGLLRGERRPFGIRWNKVAGLDGFPVHAVREALNGDLWLGTETHGAASLDPRTGRVKWFGVRQGLVGKEAYTLLFDREHRLWVGTDAGLFWATTPYAQFSRVSELPSSRVWSISEGTDGTVWFGGMGGLSSFAGGRWSNFKPADGLTNQEVLSLGAGPNGIMWVGYRFGGGVDRVHLNTGHLTIERGVQRPGTNGLIYFLDFDASGRLWVGTEHGVDVWDGAHWSHYDTNDGLAGDDCNLNGFSEEPDGTVWIGTSGGLSHFKPRPRALSEEQLHVVFTRLFMGPKDVTTQIKSSSGVHANSLVARYSALNASRENGVLFRYRLLGANSNWTETGQRELQFAELAPGAYQLEVEAQDSYGVWSMAKATFAFRILTPWYLSWWFTGLCVLIPVAGAAAAVRSRIASLERRERALRQLMAAQDEIRSLSFYDPLTGLANRRLLLDQLDNSLAGAGIGPMRALLFVDLDNFKTLNDTLGYDVGDLLL